MVTFGANWCMDCRTLHHHLNNEPGAGYTRNRFLFVNVDVGKFNQNRDVAERGRIVSRDVLIRETLDW